MVDSKENYKFDLGFKGLKQAITSLGTKIINIIS